MLYISAIYNDTQILYYEMRLSMFLTGVLWNQSSLEHTRNETATPSPLKFDENWYADILCSFSAELLHQQN